MVLVDTSAWIHALRPDGSAGVQAVVKPIIVGRQAAVTEWIMLDLMTGLRKGDSKPALLRWFEPVSRLPGPSYLAEWEQVWENLAECWRDLHVVGQAVTIMPEWYPMGGRAFMDMDPGPRLR